MNPKDKTKVRPPQFSLLRVFDDPSSGQINNGFFNGTIQIALRTNLEDKDKEKLFSLITILSMKIASLWEIKGQYIAILNRLKSELKENPKGGNKNLHNYSIQATDLLGWFDVFLVQIKSIFDHLVKVPSPVFGYKCWNLASFGERGEKVRKAFLNLPKEYKKSTHNFYDAIFGRHPWINDAIEIRDKLNHGVKGGLDPKLFTVSYNEVTEKYIEPMWSQDQTIESAVEQIFLSVLNMSAMFCGLILSIKLPEDLTVICDDRELVKTKPICQIIPKCVLKQHMESSGVFDHGLS